MVDRKNIEASVFTLLAQWALLYATRLCILGIAVHRACTSCCIVVLSILIERIFFFIVT